MSSSAVITRLGPAASGRLINFAEILIAAGDLARRSLRRRYASQMVAKAPRDYQTEIDVAVEQLIVDRLRLLFPDHAIAGEEGVGNSDPTPGQPIIHIDPIDGTTNYAWGLPHFGIVLTLVEEGKVVCGAVYDPMLDELFTAERGAGAYLNGEKLVIELFGEVENALIGAGLPVPGQVKTVSEDTYFAALKRLMAETAGVRRLGSSALSTAYVACGRLDGFFEDGLSMHDVGASMLIVEEAGGIVSGFHGEPVMLPRGFLVANPALHDWLIKGFKPA
ncbi:inositol monophosphatase [Allorhizobium sp. BGMRC 0089]|uniref:inositol monophosphatase family protein n=1 Tax=Allorhizobium sonneratiae TaxID=2934936 RepID=UPI0020338274|nr:inositol monophosphatase family protein [Allorhizobium sonneratiae]MCM2291419.1 inositol monophosphatase [Allorhizobium sonneratiae]